jgi:3-deoxy-D-manno-octulosonate 8-phosphate phosphatase (KDO 8-P phosphatase)
MEQNMDNKIIEKAQEIRLLLLDCDGVMTDGGIIYTSSGEGIMHFDVKDGRGIQLLMESGIIAGIVSGSDSPIVMRRAEKLGIEHVFQSVNLKYKLAVVSELVKKLGLEMHQVAFVGDDLPDIPVLRAVGLACCPCDAVEEVKAICHYVLTKPGGRGAVRELCDIIRYSQG